MPNSSEIVSKILSFVYENDNFLLTSHINADGDAIGSLLAFSMFLDKLGKKYNIVFNDDVIDSKYNFLKNWEKITPFKKINPELVKAQTKNVLIFDAPGLKRIGDVKELIEDKTPVLKIDHHPSEDSFGSLDWVDISASSASVLVYRIIGNSKIKISKNIADALYTGIIYDTGRLSFSNTKAIDFEICGNLVKAGVNPADITHNLFFNNETDALKIIGKGLSNITQYSDGRITIIPLLESELENIEISKIEELANHSVSLKGTEVGVFIREIEKGHFKISLRSKKYVDVSKVAAQFEGGGHVRASGCRFEGNYSELISKLVDEIELQLK